MTTTFKEKPTGGYYCAECRMSFGDLHTTCPYCGSVVSNYENLLIQNENDKIRPMFDLDETGKNKFANDSWDNEPILGGRWWESFEEYQKMMKFIDEIDKEKKENESNIHGRD